MLIKTKFFKNGSSHAIRIPKSFRFNEKEEVLINKIDDIIIIFSKKKKMEILKNSLMKFTEDFMQERNQPMNKLRERF